MGLDQYWELEPTPEQKTKALLEGHVATTEEIGYHRKWHDLNEFMYNFTITDSALDGYIEVSITQDILDEVEIWCRAYHKSKDYDQYDEYVYPTPSTYLKEDIIPKIQKYLNEGREVTYSADW